MRIALAGILVLGAACGGADVGGTGEGGGDGGSPPLGDTTAPVIAGRSPAASATNVATTAWLTVTFSESVDCSSVTTTTLRISGVSGTIACAGNVASFKPSTALVAGAIYAAQVAGGSGNIRDVAGNPLAASESWNFTTATGGGGSAATEIPTTAGAATLFRYPYLQTAGPGTMKILWAATSSTGAEVRFRPAASGTWSTVAAVETFYSSAVTGFANFYQQEAVLTGLQPAMDYVYTVVHQGVELARNVPFRTLPEAADATVRFAAFGDSGTPYSDPRRVRDAIVSTDGAGNFIYPHDFVVGLGDIAYTNGTFEEFNDNFFEQMSARGDQGNGGRSLLARRPFIPVLGNHEHAQVSTGAASAATGFVSSFSLPIPAGIPAADNEFYYSFDAGNAHFAIIDSMKCEGDTTATRLGNMLAWLDEDLAASGKTWKIVFLHHALFSTGPHGTWGDIQQNSCLRAQLVPVLQNRGVQLVMFGHDHFYQRSKRLRLNGSAKIVRDAGCNVVDSAAGIVYVLAGFGGTDLNQHQVDPLAACGSGTFNSYVANYGDGYDFVATRNGAPVLVDTDTALTPSLPTVRWGFAYVTISGNTLTLTAYNYNGEILDQFSMSPN